MIRSPLLRVAQPLLRSLKDWPSCECETSLQSVRWGHTIPGSKRVQGGHTVRMLLIKDHPHLGPAGKVVTVKAGHARNDLYPNRWAIYATSKNAKKAEEVAEQRAQQPDKKSDLEHIMDAIARGMLVVRRRVSWRPSESEHMVGQVTAAHVRQLAAAQLGVDLPQELILMDKPITTPGAYKVPLGLVSREGQQLELSVDVRPTRRM